MPRGWGGAGAILLAAALGLGAGVVPAGAQWQAETTIDLNYTYEQTHAEGNVRARTGLQQMYEVRLDTTLTSSLDFAGAISLDLADAWGSDEATTSKISPSLQLGITGPQSAVQFTYAGVIDETDQFEETSGSKRYSNAGTLVVELTPDAWPEIKLSLEDRRDYEEERNENTGRAMDLQVRDEFYDLHWEFSLRYEQTTGKLPETTDNHTTDWSFKATYRDVLLYDVDFDVAYEIKETYGEDSRRDVFTGLNEDYTQSLKTRLRKSLQLASRLNVQVGWEYTYEQDLLELDYDYRIQNKYALDLRYDVLPSLKLTGQAIRETDHQYPTEGGEDTSRLTDTISGAFDYAFADWLRLGGRAEKQFDSSIDENTGGSVDHSDQEQYELTARNQYSDFWVLAVTTSWSYSHEEGVLVDREAKFKADLGLRILQLDWASMGLAPSYEATRSATWDSLGEPTGEVSTSDARIRFEAAAQLINDLLLLTFSHEYGQKITRENDAVLNYRRELTYNEDTRLLAALGDLWEGFDLEGEVERKADDTEGDAEPQVVEVSYSLRLGWQYEELSLASAFKYTDKGEDDDTAEFATQIGWRGDRFDVAGDYQLTKTYADRTDETRKFNLRLSYRF